MSALKICGVAIVCLTALLCVKNLRENFAPLIRFASVIIFTGAAVGMLAPLISFSRDTMELGGVSEQGKVVFKALGIAFLTQISSQICRDCGEGSLADSIEAVCRIELLLLALPMLSKILSTVTELLSW
ncbi:MAG: SpoIIIAC/SpoIIIAD family protein [Clostridia bacterium]|nr:SpoIIIAC/SpoIIIAD family protein [Clostridia bacterium]